MTTVFGAIKVQVTPVIFSVLINELDLIKWLTLRGIFQMQNILLPLA